MVIQSDPESDTPYARWAPSSEKARVRMAAVPSSRQVFMSSRTVASAAAAMDGQV